MGWSFTIAVCRAGHSPLASLPLDFDTTKGLIERLSLGPVTGCSFGTLEQVASTPSKRLISAVANPNGFIVSCEELIGCVERKDDLVAHLADQCCSGETLVMELSAAVNYIAYSIWVNKVEVRRYVGDSERGDVVSKGEAVSEEDIPFEAAGGQRRPVWKTAETIASALLQRFTGVRLLCDELTRTQIFRLRVGRPLWPFSRARRKGTAEVGFRHWLP